jgi:dihydropteroate synthase
LFEDVKKAPHAGAFFYYSVLFIFAFPSASLMSRQYLQCGRFDFDLAKRPLVMGILNVTPDSFSDGGRHHALEFAVEGAEQMIKDGVDIIDIGGESTRPGSPSVPVEEELRRVMPVIYALRELGVPLSIDTCKPDVMREAILAGADMINDINGFRAPGALEAVRRSDVGLCVMHMQGTPQDMQAQPVYDDVVAEVTGFLRARVDALVAGGVVRERVTIDPGFGFGKTVEHNVALLRGISDMQRELGLPVLAGLSRKSMVGALTGKPLEQRLAGSIGGALAAVAQGARIVRVHDVAETVDALKVFQAGTKNN